MHSISYQHRINATIDQVWAVFSRFQDLLVWHKLGLELEVKGQGLGMVRTLIIPDFGRVGERLDVLDHQHYKQHYSLVEGQPLGMQTYTAQIQLQLIDGQACTIDWFGEFTVAASTDANKVGTSLRGSYITMSTALATHVENAEARS